MKKINIIVFAKDEKEISKYLNLFVLLIGEHRIINIKRSKHESYLEGERFKIFFYRLREAARGQKCHYVINLVQDEELHYNVALPTTTPFSYLKDDPVWNELFKY